MALDISRIPPKGSIGYKYFRANITSAERAELDAYEAKMAATPKKDTGTKQSTSTNASANDYFDFLGDDYSGFDYVAPPLSQTDAFKEWQATVNTDRGSDEYSLQRYPDQDAFFLGEMAIPAWFPESYSAYRKAGGLSGGIAYNNPNPEFGAPRLIEESRNSAEENLARFTQTLIENGGVGGLGNIDFGNLDSMLAALQGTPFDLDALLADTKSFGGQTISEQEWFSPEREEIVRKFFEGQSNDPLDRGSLIKGQTWEEAKTALARGVDPDSVFAELNTLSNKSHDDFAAMDYNVGYDTVAGVGPHTAFIDLSDAHFIETFNTFNNELDTLRQEDPNAFQAAYEFLPVSERLGYLYGVQKAGGITNEQYEDMYMSEVNSYAEDTQDPLAPRYVKIGNKNYLYKPSAVEPDNLDVQRDLYDVNFYPDEGSITPRRSIRTDDFDDSAWDFVDTIVSVVTPFFPIVGAAYTAVKGLSGETLHVSDWLRAVPFAVEQINLATAPAPTSGPPPVYSAPPPPPTIPTTVGEWMEKLELGGVSGLGELADIPITYGNASMGALATSPMFFGQSTPIADIIKIGGLVLGQGGGTPTVPGQSGTWGGIPNSVIVNFTQQMDASGVPIPEGAFEVDPETGMFTSSSGQLIDFADAFSELVDIFRKEDPVAFAETITAEDVDPSIAEVVGEDTFNVAQFLVDARKSVTGEQDPVISGTAYGDFMNEVNQFLLAAALETGGNIVTQINGVLQLGQIDPNNTKLAGWAKTLLDMADESKSDTLKESIQAAQDYEASFEDKVYFEAESEEEVKNGNVYKATESILAERVAAGNMSQEDMDKQLKNIVDGEKNRADTYNDVINVINSTLGSMMNSPMGTAYELYTELGEELFNFWVSSKVGLMAKGIAGTSTAVARKLGVKDLTDDVLAQLNKVEKFSTLSASTLMDIAEAVGGESAGAYNEAIATQEKVETEAIHASAEFKAAMKANNSLVQSGVMSEEEYQAAAKEYTREKLDANNGALRRQTVAAGIALKTGLFAGGMTVASNMVLGDAFDKKIFTEMLGKKADMVTDLSAGMLDRAKEWANKTGAAAKKWFMPAVKEPAGEIVEEGSVSAFKNIQLKEIDPTINVTRQSVGDGVRGGVISTGVTTSIVSATALNNALNNVGINTGKDADGNLPDWMNSANGTDYMKDYGTAPEGYVDLPDADVATRALANFNPPINAAMQTNPDGTAVLTEQGIKDIFASAGLSAEDFPRSYATLMNHVYDGNYTSPSEAAAAFDEAGYTPSQEEIDTYIGDTYGDDALGQAIDDYVDPRQTTLSEVEEYARAAGVELNDAQLQSLVGQYDNPQDDTDRLIKLISSDTDLNDLFNLGTDPDPITGDPDPITGDPDPITGDPDPITGDPDPITGDPDPITGDPDPITGDPDPDLVDSDGDGIPDIYDKYPDDPENIDRTADRDGDGIPDFEDEYPNDPDNIDRTTDSDGDGIPDYVDEYPDDPENIDRTADADGDGIPDFEDEYPLDPKNIDRITDTDGDGVPDYIDEFPDDPDNIDKDAILEAIAANEEAGLSRDEAIKKAIDDVAADLGTTKSDVLTAIGETEESLLEAIGGVSAAVDLNAEAIAGAQAGIDDLIAAGLTRDEAIAAVAEQLGTTEENILKALGETEESLITRFDEGMADLGLDIEAVASYVGKPPQDVTQTDIDFIADVIAQQEVLEDPTSFVPTDQQLQYDVNNDGVIDINDQLMLEQAFSGQDVALGGQFASTGLYAYNDQIAAEQAIAAEQQFETEQQLAQDRQMQLQTQMTQQQGFDQLDRTVRDMAALEAAQQRVATTQQKGVAEIDYLYDIGGESVFATPQQQSLFASPYARGGEVKDSTDRLLKIIGED